MHFMKMMDERAKGVEITGGFRGTGLEISVGFDAYPEDLQSQYVILFAITAEF